MTNASRKKGTVWESSVVDYLKSFGWKHAERRALAGKLDRGDIAGLPGVVVECKNARTIALAAWLDEANTERDNDGADIGAVWFKRRGKTDAGAGYVVIDGRTFAKLLTAAGYGGSA